VAGAYGHLQSIGRYWDSVAFRYLELFRHELHGKQFDRETLQSFAADLGPDATVCDVGCGPCGHVTRLLSDCGVHARGVDLSSACVALARTEQPALRFDVMDMGAMTFDDGVFDGLVAYYVLHYEPRASIQRVLGEFWRVLRPGGRILLVAKDGDGEGLVADPLGTGQEIFWSALPENDLVVLLAVTGFRILSSTVREPLPDEMQVPRIYVYAERPGLRLRT
jgi:ubiquinone/menaquinone biosynthesis C-methylase UbiE